MYLFNNVLNYLILISGNMPAKVNIGVVNLISEIKTELQGKASAEKLDELAAEIRSRDCNIELLESRIAIVENTMNLLTQKSDDNNQYSRRLSLCINNIPLLRVNQKETSEDVLKKVKDIIAEREANIPDNVLDRAHPVGKAFTTEDGTEKQQVIAKFATWHHRILFYKNRKN